MNFPTSEIGILLQFARGQVAFNAEVFDAAIVIVSYFGKMFINQPQVYGSTFSNGSTEDIVSVLESLNVEAGLTDGHPVASLSPILVSMIIQYAIKVLLRNLSSGSV